MLRCFKKKQQLSLPVVESPTLKPTPYTHSGQEVAMVNNKALLKPKEKHLRNDVLKFGFNKLLEDCTGDIFSCQLCHYNSFFIIKHSFIRSHRN